MVEARASSVVQRTVSIPQDLIIGDVDFSDEMLDAEIDDSTTHFVGEAFVEIIDTTDLINTTIERYQELKIFEAGIPRFTGVVVEIHDSDESDGLLEIIANDYMFYALRTPVFRTFVAQSASDIIISLTQVELAFTGMGTSKIVATTTLYDYEFRGRSCMSIFQELALKENFVVHADEVKDVVFESDVASDTGVHLSEVLDNIIEESFTREGAEIVNVVIVRGSAGRPPKIPAVGAIYEDEALIAKYKKLPMIEITEPELTTELACYERAVFEVRRRAQDPQIGMVLADLDFTLKKGQLVTLTIPDRNITASKYLIQTANHNIVLQETRLQLVYYTRQTADLVQLIIENAKKAEQYLSDEAIIFTKYKTIEKILTATVTVDVERQTVTGASYGEFNYGGVKYYGQASGSYAFEPYGVGQTMEEVSIIGTNQGIEDLLRIISQLAPFPTVLDQTNTYIAISGSPTAIGVDTTTLTGESLREMCNAGFPNQPADATLEWQIVISDGDVVNTIIRSLALFNHPTVGNLEYGGVLPADVVKGQDENIRITFRIVLSGLTDAGHNLLIDLFDGTDVTNYLDASGAFMNVVLTNPPPTDYSELCNTTAAPAFTGTFDEVLFEMEVDGDDVQVGGLNNEAFKQFDLYQGDPDAAGIAIATGFVVSSIFQKTQKHRLQYKVRMVAN